MIDTLLDALGDPDEQQLRYRYSNHLQSATLELDAAGAIISYEEYYPYGSTGFKEWQKWDGGFAKEIPIHR